MLVSNPLSSHHFQPPHQILRNAFRLQLRQQQIHTIKSNIRNLSSTHHNQYIIQKQENISDEPVKTKDIPCILCAQQSDHNRRRRNNCGDGEWENNGYDDSNNTRMLHEQPTNFTWNRQYIIDCFLYSQQFCFTHEEQLIHSAFQIFAKQQQFLIQIYANTSWKNADIGPIIKGIKLLSHIALLHGKQMESIDQMQENSANYLHLLQVFKQCSIVTAIFNGQIQSRLTQIDLEHSKQFSNIQFIKYFTKQLQKTLITYFPQLICPTTYKTSNGYRISFLEQLLESTQKSDKIFAINTIHQLTTITHLPYNYKIQLKSYISEYILSKNKINQTNFTDELYQLQLQLILALLGSQDQILNFRDEDSIKEGRKWIEIRKLFGYAGYSQDCKRIVDRIMDMLNIQEERIRGGNSDMEDRMIDQ